MAPNVYYRVQSKSSRGVYVKRKGILAKDRKTRVDFESYTRNADEILVKELKNHLNWGSRIPSTLISVYSDEKVAEREAERRVLDGQRGVRIYKIDTSCCKEKMEYRNVRFLADKLDVYIPDRAWNNSMYEYVFLYRIPDSAVVKVWLYDEEEDEDDDDDDDDDDDEEDEEMWGFQ